MRPLVLAKETGERLANTFWVIVLMKNQLSDPESASDCAVTLVIIHKSVTTLLFHLGVALLQNVA